MFYFYFPCASQKFVTQPFGFGYELACLQVGPMSNMTRLVAESTDCTLWLNCYFVTADSIFATGVSGEGELGGSAWESWIGRQATKKPVYV